MSNNKSLYKECNINRYCNSLANKKLVLVTIFAAIISQEIQDDEELGILASFIIAVGEELALASETRIACKARIREEEEELGENELEEDNFDEIGFEDVEIEDVFDRGYKNKNNTINTNKKYIKKTKKIRKK